MKALKKVKQIKEWLLQLRLAEARDRQLVRLKQWEDDINAQCSDSAKISVENAVDLAPPPDNFIYKNDYVVSEGRKNDWWVEEGVRETRCLREERDVRHDLGIPCHLIALVMEEDNI